jgi:hypothetical protein
MTPADITGAGTQLAIREIQTREYDTLDKATRLHEYTMRMTVTTVEKDKGRIAVRANARIDENPVQDAATYQDFFVVLDKAMFLTLNKVD